MTAPRFLFFLLLATTGATIFADTVLEYGLFTALSFVTSWAVYSLLKDREDENV
jgi:hypothetical protein